MFHDDTFSDNGHCRARAPSNADEHPLRSSRHDVSCFWIAITTTTTTTTYKKYWQSETLFLSLTPHISSAKINRIGWAGKWNKLCIFSQSTELLQKIEKNRSLYFFIFSSQSTELPNSMAPIFWLHIEVLIHDEVMFIYKVRFRNNFQVR